MSVRWDPAVGGQYQPPAPYRAVGKEGSGPGTVRAQEAQSSFPSWFLLWNRADHSSPPKWTLDQEKDPA